MYVCVCVCVCVGVYSETPKRLSAKTTPLN